MVPLVAERQYSLFDWLKARSAPRGAVSSELGAVDDATRALHRRLESALGTVDLVITDNRKRMVTARRRGVRHELRVHHMFLGCDDEALTGLVLLARGERDARGVLRNFIAQNRDAIRNPEVRAESEGRVHDLEQALQDALGLADAVLDELPSLDHVRIGWGRDGRGRRSIRFGSYDFEQGLIRVHPALDAEEVPEYFVHFVVYHELLHAVVPPKEDAAGRRILHSREFRELEARYPRYDEAMAWERANLERLLNR